MKFLLTDKYDRMVLLHLQGEGGTILFDVCFLREDWRPPFQFQTFEGGSSFPFEVADEQIGAACIRYDNTIPTFWQSVFQGDELGGHLLSLLGIDTAVIDEVAGIDHLASLDGARGVGIQRIEFRGEDGVVRTSIAKGHLGFRV